MSIPRRSGSGAHTHATAHDRLLQQVVEANGDLQDVMDMAATIESLGWSDQRVEDTFGQPTVFDLAQELFNEYLTTVRSEPVPPRFDLPWYRVLRQLAVDFLHGLTFALPMAVSVASMVILRISISSFQYFSVPQATALAMATFLSFVVTGGFTQAMATVYYVLLGLQEAGLIERTLYLIMRWGFVSAVVLALGVLLGDALFPMFPLSLALFMVVYLILLSLLWLSYASLYVLRREYVLTLVTASAILIAYAIWRAGYNVILAQAIAMISATIIATLAWLVIFRRQSRRWDHTGRIVRTRNSQLAYASGPYFLYGLLYFVFIFADRLVSWTTATSFTPYTIWFRGQYELGMDWALASLILPLAATEAFVGYFIRWLMAAQGHVSEHDVAALAVSSRNTYTRLMVAYLLVATAASLILRLGIGLAEHVHLLSGSLPTSSIESFVFSWASFGYIFLAISLFNILLLFSLAYPVPALRSLLIALAVDVGVGIVATRVFAAYQFAVIGLLAGVTCLLVLSTRDVLRTLPNIDFMLYRMV